MIADMSLYQICWYFLIYAFLGWVVEVAFHAVTMGKVVNRGFLNGPVCPIYGFGMVGVLILSHLLADAAQMEELSMPLLFLVGMVFSSLAELIAGWAMDHFFHARWWDYSKMPLNFHGYICLAFSLLWGLGVVAAVDLVHPVIANYTVAAIPPRYGWPIQGVFLVLLGTDTGVTLATVIGLNKKLQELDELNQVLRRPSDAIAASVTDKTIKAAKRIEEGRVQAALGKAELRDELNSFRKEKERRRAELLSRFDWRTRRLLHAFPELRHHDFSESLEQFRQVLEDSYNKKAS